MAKGTGSSLSVNGGKTNVNADSKIVNEQSGIFSNEADLVAEGKGTFKGSMFVTSKEAQTNGKSNIVFKQGISSQDIKNTTSYEGEALSIGLSIGNTTGKPQATMNGIGYGTDSNSDSSITKGGVSGYNDPQGILTTENREALAGKLDDVFDANRVNEELGAQTQITQEFGKEAPKAVGDFANNRIKAIIADTTLSNAEKNAAIAKWDEGGVYRVAAHTALGALGTGSVEGALSTGGVAAAAPTLNNLQDKIAESLIASGMSESIAKGTASGVISLALLGAGTAAGLDTSSTVTATNVDANNRQLHPDQIKFLKLHAEDYAKEKGITKEEALKILARAAVYNLDKGWYDAYNTYLSLDEIKQFDDASKFLEERNGHHIQNTASVESYNRINDPDGIEPNIVDTGVLRGPFRNENPEYYTDSRLYLDEMLTDADSVQFVLDNLALQNPYTYGRTPETAAEVQNAKAEGSNQGAGNLILAPWELAKEGIDKLQDPYGTVIDGFNSIGNAIKAIPSIPEKAKQTYEDFTYIGHEDNLAIMQGKGLDVARNDAQSSTKLGIGIGLGGVVANLTKPKPNTLAVSETKTVKVENNVNIDNDMLSNDLNRANFRGQQTQVNNPIVLDSLLERNGVVLKEGTSAEDVFNTVMTKDRGDRANPSSYLDSSYVNQQLSLFDEGATKFMVNNSYNKYGLAQVDGTSFVLPKTQADELMNLANGNPSKLADSLGIPRDMLKGNSLVRIDIKNPRDAGLRLPSGNEAGANSSWMPGGKLPDGNTEAVLDADKISNDYLKITTIE